MCVCGGGGGGGGAGGGVMEVNVVRLCEPVFRNPPHSYTWPSKKQTHSYGMAKYERNLHFAKGTFLSRKEGFCTKGKYLWGPGSEFSYKRVPYSMI